MSITTYYGSYSYTAPLAEALATEFGTSFNLINTGGGCICLEASLEGGLQLLIGSAVDGPLLTDSERTEYSFDGGYGVGVYRTSLDEQAAYAMDNLAETAADVVALVKRAMELSRGDTATDYPVWERAADGEVTTYTYGK
jgi:hypothetical protein